MTSRFIFWLWFAGLVFLVIGLISVRKQLSFKPDGFTALGRVFVAASLALFGAEHLSGARFLMQTVPPWMPGRLFWAYFVGFALLAAATSFVLMKYVRLSASLLGLMIFLFVLMIHLPNAARNAGNRIVWTVAVRDFLFATGAWALALTQTEEWRVHGSHRLIGACRVVLALTLLFFGIEHFLHPEFVPGVPLGKLTPESVPVRPLWGYLTGAALLVSGAALLANKQARSAAAWLGILLTLLLLFIYLPMLAAATEPSAMTEALNYIGDTLLFAGTILLVAAAIPAASPAAQTAPRAT